MEVEVKQVKGISFVGRADSDHWVVMDGPSDLGGYGAGSRPMELLLIALGGCTGMDVVTLLDKMRVEYDHLEIRISASQREEYPKIFTEIHVEYKIFGEEVSEDKVKKAIDKSQNKYCPITGILKESADISYNYEIIEE